MQTVRSVGYRFGPGTAVLLSVRPYPEGSGQAEPEKTVHIHGEIPRKRIKQQIPVVYGADRIDERVIYRACEHAPGGFIKGSQGSFL